MEKFKFYNKSLKVKENANKIGGCDFIAEDYWINIEPCRSWMLCDGNPACMIYAIRIVDSKIYIPLDDNVVYGKINGIGYLVHENELELTEEVNK